jgi:hypothetical protein
VDFVAGNSNKLQKKIGFGRKNQLSPQRVHTWANGTSYTIVVVKMGVNMCEHGSTRTKIFFEESIIPNNKSMKFRLLGPNYLLHNVVEVVAIIEKGCVWSQTIEFFLDALHS